MTEKFHRELKDMKAEVQRMGALARGMLRDSIKALKDRDKELAEDVISRKTDLANFDNSIEERSLHLLTLYSPMAVDLRTIACILKLITYLNRVGRYGKSIAMVAIELHDRPHINKLVSIPHMADIVDGMIVDALEAFENRTDIDIGNFVEKDDCVDSIRHSIFREVITYMMEDSRYIRQGAHYAMVARYLERCADHACKMAEKIHYMVAGQHIDIEGKGDVNPSCVIEAKKSDGI
jgi:phosphate transport system protein